jgi:hypothetical protein
MGFLINYHAMGRNLGKVKQEAGKVFEKAKDIPIIGDIARLVEASPIGMMVKRASQGIDDAAAATSSLFRGDIKGAIEQGIQGAVNYYGSKYNIS